MSTLGDTRSVPLDPHRLEPTLSRDAVHYRRTEDRFGRATGGIITGAHGYGRETEPGDDASIATIARRGCKRLADKLARGEYDDWTVLADDAVLCGLVEETANEGMLNSRGFSASLAGVRLYEETEGLIRAVGVSVGDQRLFLTDVTTGQTIALNNGAADAPCSRRYLGGERRPSGHYRSEIETINKVSRISSRENAMVWIASEGAWQNFPKREGDPWTVDVRALSGLIAGSLKREHRSIIGWLAALVLVWAEQARERLVSQDVEALRAAYRGVKDQGLRGLSRRERGVEFNGRDAMTLGDASLTMLQPFLKAPA